VIPKECKRLAEVDFPIAVVSKHSAREKSVRNGHPSTLHLWWARRPLGACRAMLLALLLPDPCDKHCPAEFKKQARAFLARTQGEIDPNGVGLRKAMLNFIGDFSAWENSSHPVYLEVSRSLIKAAYPEEMPLVADPFAGGGSIPLEALRLGCDAFASDLNPIACLINKVMLEAIPCHGHKLAEELRSVAAKIKAVTERELAKFYPPDPDGARPVAYLWARTARCEQPNCGCEIPLVRSFWLRKTLPKQALRMKIARYNKKPPDISFEVFAPKTDAEVPPSTVFQGKATCPACNSVLQSSRLRSQMIEQQGGVNHLCLLAVVLQARDGEQRTYRPAQRHDLLALARVRRSLAVLPSELRDMIPSEPIPLTELRRVAAPLYGCTSWSSLFTPRQQLALAIVAEAIASHTKGFIRDFSVLAFGKVLRHWNTNARWHNGSETVAGAFGRQAIPMSWTFPERSPWAGGAGSLDDAFHGVAAAIDSMERFFVRSGQAVQADACSLPLPSASTNVWFTDPPYYDAVAYAHLADFFYVWFKRLLQSNSAFATALIDKKEECVVDRPHSRSPSQTKTAVWFENKMTAAMSDGFRVLSDDGIGAVVFAHKSTEGWEALIGGMLRAGWIITASWPVTTERGARLNARDNASLAASVHLVCRPRSADAPIGEWSTVRREMPIRVAEWMQRMEEEHVRGADLVFACIGPALEVFSRYSRVETANGEEISLPVFLEKVWEEIGRAALKQVLGTDSPGDYGEDARLTALFLWTLRTTNGWSETNGNNHLLTEDEDDDADDDSEEPSAKAIRGFALPYDIVRRFSQPLGIHLEKWEGRLIKVEKGIVRLLSIGERASQLVGPGVVQDLALAGLAKRKKNAMPMLPFAEAQPDADDEKVKAARSRVEKATWSHLHLDTIPTLDHIHKAMLFQKQGQTTALRELLFYEQHYRPEFIRVSNSLSALYPKDSEEKRLLDAMLLAMPK